MKAQAANKYFTKLWRDERSYVHLLTVLLAVLLSLMCSLGLAGAQSGASSVEGTVTDSTGAAIVGASIHVVNEATGVSVDTRSNHVGFYQVPGLFTGTYAVTVTAQGMKTTTTTVELHVAQAAVLNPSLPPGSVSEKILVTSEVTQLVTPDNATITSTLENQRINQLPMNGRLLLSLAGMTTPGLEGGGQRANGLMPEALEYVQDGAPLSNRNFGGAVNSTQAQLPDPDAVQEVRIETANTSAQYSEPGTAIITTKSGTNGLHGSLFETARNNAIGVARARQNPANFSAPHLVRNEFGASIGGPVIIPGLYNGKDKTFWFFAYERFSLAQSTYQLQTVPNMAMRSGDWSGLVNGAGQLQQLYDPSTTAPSANCNGTGIANMWCRAPFQNNQIPLSRLAPTAKILYDITPRPTTNDNPLVAPNLNAVNPTYQVIPTVTVRFDHTFNEKNKAYLRYTDNIQFSQTLRNSPNNQPSTIAADGIPVNAAGYGSSPIATFSGAFGYYHIFSPTFFVETLLSQQWESENSEGGGNPGLNYEQIFGLPNNFGQPGFPSIGNNLLMNYLTTQFNYKESQIISNIDENFTKIYGNHQFLFGGRYRHERFAYLPDRTADAVNFGNYATALENPASGSNYSPTPNTGFADADLYLGAGASFSNTLNSPVTHFHDMEFDVYFQDNYHVTKYLTANLGLRYEAHPSPWVKDGLFQSIDLVNHATVLPNPISYYIAHGYTTQAIVTNLLNDGMIFETPDHIGYPTTMMRNYNLTFGPRIGLAYQPFSGRRGTVIRGGYGRYIYPVPTRNTIRAGMINEPFQTTYSQSYTAPNQSPDGLANYLLRSSQPSIIGAQGNSGTSGVVNSSSANAITPNFQAVTVAPNLAPDFVTQANLTIEQPFKGHSALRVSWLWSHGTNLDHYYHYDAAPSVFIWHMRTGLPTPSGSTIGLPTYAATGRNPWDQTKYNDNELITKDGFSNDNALQVNFQRLYHRGVSYQVSYVFSSALRMGGNTFRDNYTYSTADYLSMGDSIGKMSPIAGAGSITAPIAPPFHPAGLPSYSSWHGLNKYEGYVYDTAIPRHHISFNGIWDLPFGQGKRFFGNTNRFVDELIGGFQIAWDGNVVSQAFQVSASNWGAMNPIKVYKHKAKITDCRSGVCRPAYLWFNGYISPTTINTSKGVSGLPLDYVPYLTPINNTPGTPNYGNNNVQVTLSNGQTVLDNYQPAPVAGATAIGAHPYSKTFFQGPFNYTADLSVFKVFPITEKTTLRVNVDAFNVLNMQGYTNPDPSSGIESLTSSANTPRQIQLTARFTF
jgi:hypothetical protein